MAFRRCEICDRAYDLNSDYDHVCQEADVRTKKVRELNDLRRQSPDVSEMVRGVLVAEELESVSALAARDPEVFDALHEMCVDFLALEVSNPDQWSL